MVKQSLQFLNAFGFSGENKIMFFARQSDKINRTVIGLNPVKVMDVPSFWQWFPVDLFPYQKMFCDISYLSSTWVLGIPHQNIPIPVNNPSTFPVIPLPVRGNICSTLDTSFRSLVFWFTTYRAWRLVTPNVVRPSLPLFSYAE